MDIFLVCLTGVCATGFVFLAGWRFGMYLQGLADTKTIRDLYSDERAEFYNDYYGDAKVKYGASDALHHHKPKAKKPRKKKGA